MTPTPLIMAERVRNAAAMGESHFREFKSAIEGPPTNRIHRNIKRIRYDIAEALIAFANADGGELLVGVEDDGRISGVPHDAHRVEVILRAPEELVLQAAPLSGVTKSAVEVDGMVVLYFSVQKSMSYIHQLTDGRCVRRLDLETVPAEAATLRLDREEELSRQYDRDYLDGATIADLDADLLQQSTDVISRGSTPEMLLQQLGIADFSAGTLRLRRAALLLFATEVERWHPRCAIRLLVVDGAELLTGGDYNVVSDATISGPIIRIAGEAWDMIRPHLSRTSLSARGRFEESVLFPEDACREALVNAVAHRSYSIEGRLIEVYVYRDRLEVVSPGRLLQTVPLESLASGGGVHESRNTLIARTLRELGLMREMGEGVRRMFALMRLNDLVDPEFDAQPESFTTRLANRTVYPREALQWLAGYRRFNLTRDEERVVLLGADGALLSPVHVMQKLGLVDSDDYRPLATALQAKGVFYSTMNKRQTQAISRRKRKRPREIPRMRVRPPAEAVAYLDDLIEVLSSTDVSFPLTRKEVGAIRSRLSNGNPFAERDHHLFDSLVALNLLDGHGDPAGELLAGIHAREASDQSVGPSSAESRALTADEQEAADVLDTLLSAAEALGVELTLQYAGNRLRGQIGPDKYSGAIGRKGLRHFVQSLGTYEVVDDHGRHVVERTP